MSVYKAHCFILTAILLILHITLACTPTKSLQESTTKKETHKHTIETEKPPSSIGLPDLIYLTVQSHESDRSISSN